MSLRMINPWLIGFLLLAGPLLAAPPAEITGKVTHVSDGDTIKILVKKQELTIRLEGIDAPEASQDYGNKSKQALAALVSGKMVTVRKSGVDKFGRTLGIVFVEGKDVNALQIEAGYAWHFKAFNKEDRLAKLEAEAQRAKRGLWAGNQPVEPWIFRERAAKAAGAK